MGVDNSRSVAPRGRLFVVGSANMDLVVRAPRLPSPGDTVVGDDLVRVPGGKGANQAVAAARLGARCVFVGCVGGDAFGEELRSAIAADGVDMNHLRTVGDRPSGVALIVVDEHGENLIAVSPGANAALSVADVDAALANLSRDDVVLTQLEVPFETVAEACRRGRDAAAHVVLNAAPAQPAIREHLGLPTTLIVNRGEAHALTGVKDHGGAAQALLRLGPRVVVVTLGGDGVFAATRDEAVLIPALTLDVVDTTAAGDAFAGAYAVALLEGSGAEQAARFANVAAALATTKLGAQSSLPRRAEVDSVRMQQGGH
jgi:ribokinase